jgi:plastocyanin
MMRRKILVVLALLLGAVPLLAIPVTGRIRVTGRTATATVTTIVYAEPLDGNVGNVGNVGSARPQPATFTLLQSKKSFQPRVLAIPTGSTVRFPNQDSVFHNVFSLNKPEPFDLGLYRAGASKSQTFTAPGVYRVFCDIHPQMAAVILVASYIAEVDASGAYRLDLPAGRYRITAWSERSEPASAEVTVSAGSTSLPDLTLDESKATTSAHAGKFGQAYPKAAYDGKK